MNSVREIERINQQELDRGIAGTSASWHSKYANSAWCYLGNLDHQLTEGDILCVMSQYGEVDDIHLVREEDTGKSRGFAFLKYEDARSCVLAVDNFCGVKVLGRTLRVDHVEQYRLPKKLQENDPNVDGGKPRIDGSNDSGHAYAGMELENNYNIHQGMDLFAPPPPADAGEKQGKGLRDGDKNETRSVRKLEKRKRKEERQQKRIEKEKRRRRREERREEREDKARRKRVKKYAD